MKILHKYEDGTLKVVYNNGLVGLLPAIKTVDAKIVVMFEDETFSIPIEGDLPTEIGENEAKWLRLSGTCYSEILYKLIYRAGLICARALGSEAIEYFQKCLPQIKEVLCKNEKSETSI